jgi:hypothetical protein
MPSVRPYISVRYSLLFAGTQTKPTSNKKRQNKRKLEGSEERPKRGLLVLNLPETVFDRDFVFLNKSTLLSNKKKVLPAEYCDSVE